MEKHVFVVLTNPVAGREEEFNDWYDKEHVSDIVNVPGFQSGQRYRFSSVQRDKPPHPYSYMALYEIETDDLQGTMDELGRRIGTGEIAISSAMDKGRIAALFDPIGQRLVKA